MEKLFFISFPHCFLGNGCVLYRIPEPDAAALPSRLTGPSRSEFAVSSDNVMLTLCPTCLQVEISDVIVKVPSLHFWPLHLWKHFPIVNATFSLMVYLNDFCFPAWNLD